MDKIRKSGKCPKEVVDKMIKLYFDGLSSTESAKETILNKFQKNALLNISKELSNLQDIEDVCVQYGEKKIFIFNPKPDDFDINMIASSLSRQCRFNGHIRDDIEIYSVAQHSFLVAENLPPEYKLVGLLHDAVESFLLDLITPIKALSPIYKMIENKCYDSISQKFNLPNPIPKIVKEVDIRVLLTEKRDLLTKCDYVWEQEKYFTPYEHFKITDCWLPFRAKKEFLKRFYELTENR